MGDKLATMNQTHTCIRLLVALIYINQMEVEEMKLIKHLIIIDLDENKKMLVNSLNGVVDQIALPLYNVISKWRELEIISPKNELEDALFAHLLKKGYIVNDHNEEQEKKDSIINILRERHKMWQNNRTLAVFIITYNCNFKCSYCFEGNNNQKESATLTPQQIDAALSIMGDSLEKVCFFGGEPLLLENMEVIEYIISKVSDKYFSMYTNGYNLAEFFPLFEKVKFDNIIVTLDGDECTHDKRRCMNDGGPTFKKIVSGIELYLKNNVRIIIRVNTNKDNIKEVDDLRNKLIRKFESYLDNLSFEVAPMINESIEKKYDMIAEMFEIDFNYSQEEKARRNRFNVGNKDLIDLFTTELNQLTPRYSFCSAHVNTMAFDPYGDIYSCLVAVNNKNVSIGTYYPELRYKEESMYTRNIETIPECASCIYAFLCGGGCAMSVPNKSSILNPACKSTMLQMHSLIPRYYKTVEARK